MFKTIDEGRDWAGKRVLVRVDWNVPIVDGVVQDDFRIEQSMKTINFLKDAGAQVMLMTHLEPEELSTELLRAYVPKGVELLENLRHNPGEKSNDPAFAQILAGKAEIYVNEAFSVSHRKHASIVGVPALLPSFAGFQFREEVLQLSVAFNPIHPFLFILGGAKFETKLPLVERFQDIADDIFIAGANAKPASEMGFAGRPHISLPLGDVAALDADEANLALLKEKIDQAAFIVWNGPLGWYEKGYTAGTLALARMLAESKAQVIVGGADTLTAIKQLDLHDAFTFVSTGGGAMLDFLANKTLPGIEVLTKN